MINWYRSTETQQACPERRQTLRHNVHSRASLGIGQRLGLCLKSYAPLTVAHHWPTSSIPSLFLQGAFSYTCRQNLHLRDCSGKLRYPAKEILLLGLLCLFSIPPRILSFLTPVSLPQADSASLIDIFWATHPSWPLPFGAEMVFQHLSSRKGFTAAVSLAARVWLLCWVQPEKCFPTG